MRAGPVVAEELHRNYTSAATCALGPAARFANMRDCETINSELRLLAAVRRTVHEEGGPMLTPAPIDELLDECLAHRDGAGEAFEPASHLTPSQAFGVRTYERVTSRRRSEWVYLASANTR